MRPTEHSTPARRAGALQMALTEPDDGAMPPTSPPPSLNDTLRETARLTSPPPPPPTRGVSPTAYQSAMDAARDVLGLAPQGTTSDERLGPHSSAPFARRRAMHRIRETARPAPDRAPERELPAPAPLPVQYVRLAHVPRDPSQSPVGGAAAAMRTWVLVDEEDLVPPPPLPKPVERNRPRPPLALGTCCICLDDRWTCEVVFTGCGHMCTCLPCSQRLLQATGSSAAPCPLCRIKSRPLLVRVG